MTDDNNENNNQPKVSQIQLTGETFINKFIDNTNRFATLGDEITRILKPFSGMARSLSNATEAFGRTSDVLAPLVVLLNSAKDAGRYGRIWGEEDGPWGVVGGITYGFTKDIFSGVFGLGAATMGLFLGAGINLGKDITQGIGQGVEQGIGEILQGKFPSASTFANFLNIPNITKDMFFGAYNGAINLGNWETDKIGKGFDNYVNWATGGFLNDIKFNTEPQSTGPVTTPVSPSFQDTQSSGSTSPNNNPDSIFNQPYQDAPTNSAASTLTADNAYAPVTNQVNYDQTQRIEQSNGTINTGDNSQSYSNNADNSQNPISSQPYNQEDTFSTPNSQMIQQTLYSGVQLGAQYLGGYLFNRLFGNTKYGKTMNTIRKYYDWGSMALKTFAPNAWSAVSGAVLNAAGWVASEVAAGVGVIAGAAVAAASAVASATATAATAIVAAASAAASTVATVVGSIIAFLFSW